eukprot:GILJ01004614.1.p1 GENE.GILJ01004614.1~~GILJ01004614.1.p1  ORF type:complete len:288 (-),score=15.90 GILJ01004614.1:126-989(-)
MFRLCSFFSAFRPSSASARNGRSLHRLMSSDATENMLLSASDRARQKKITYFLYGPGILLATGLGIWQTRRYIWKNEVLKLREQRSFQEPTAITSGPIWSTSDSDIEYRPVSLTGTFLPEKQILTGPRAKGRGETVGYTVYTPFLLDDGTMVVVNRGWVPKPVLDKGTKLTCPQGRQTITGLIRFQEDPSRFAVPNDITSKVFSYLNLQDIARAIDAPNHEHASFAYIQQTDFSPSRDGSKYPQAADKNDMLNLPLSPAHHMEYAITWYTLAACLGFVAHRRLRLFR